MALAVLPLVVDRLRGAVVRNSALVAAGLAATVFLPGALGDERIDARPANVFAAAGVGLVLCLTIAAARTGGSRSTCSRSGRLRKSRARRRRLGGRQARHLQLVQDDQHLHLQADRRRAVRDLRLFRDPRPPRMYRVVARKLIAPTPMSFQPWRDLKSSECERAR
jgi:hypothetical protein